MQNLVMEVVGESETPILRIQDLCVKRSGVEVLSGVNLEIQRGEFVGIVGPNGSGKSTLILTILGILKARSGIIQVYGKKPMARENIGKIGWVSQAAAYVSSNIHISVRELISLGVCNVRNMFQRKTKYERQKIEEAIEMVGLQDQASTNLNKLSGGQKQRAAIGRALASDAEFILLDEPLVGIDRQARNELLKLLDTFCHENQKTILMVSHDLSAIRQTAHRMIYLEETIHFDGPSETFPDLLELADLRGINHVHDDHPENIKSIMISNTREEE
ncbi:MAG: hypothetical protein CMB51_04320 [Euryarchaeota archaeon]|nr:hypothetical protein [Euryarchaeota archaeon]DAC15604.1 MAG TPA: metal ABC transporter ATP-binding protein [Candidatus Poseidoniales archaeon]HII63266.1 metal ABC transporter ATP-binding protein [Candidatus Poseidoniaceae archaeon]